MRQRLEGEAIQEDADQGDDHQRQCDIDQHGRMAGDQHGGHGEHDSGQDDIGCNSAQHEAQVQRAPRREQVEAERRNPHDEGELGRARHLAGAERGIGQRAIGDELALRDQDHARHGEHQHQRQPQEGVDRAVGDAVLNQEQHDRGVQVLTLPLRGRPRERAGRCVTAVEKAL